MWENISPEKCKFYFKSHFYKPVEEITKKDIGIKPAITISREEGAGGHTVASNLVDYMQAHVSTHDEWTVFDRNLVERVLEDHNLQKWIADFMTEGHKGMMTDVFEEFLGLHPSTWTLVEKINATIISLAQMGNVILVGRGGSIVTRDLPNVFRVRLVGSLEKRVAQIEKVFNLDQKSALNFIKKNDKASRRYVKDNFDKDIDDPLLYHITINTDMVQYDEAARLIGDEVIKRFKLDKPGK